MGFGIIIISMLFLLAMVATVLGAVAIGRGRSGELGRPDPAGLAEISKLRDDVDRLSAEVHRLQDEQSFIVDLLGDVEKKKLLEGPPKDG